MKNYEEYISVFKLQGKDTEDFLQRITTKQFVHLPARVTGSRESFSRSAQSKWDSACDDELHIMRMFLQKHHPLYAYIFNSNTYT